MFFMFLGFAVSIPLLILNVHRFFEFLGFLVLCRRARVSRSSTSEDQIGMNMSRHEMWPEILAEMLYTEQTLHA